MHESPLIYHYSIAVICVENVFAHFLSFWETLNGVENVRSAVASMYHHRFTNDQSTDKILSFLCNKRSSQQLELVSEFLVRSWPHVYFRSLPPELMKTFAL